MKNAIIIIALLFTPFLLKAQAEFKTIVPNLPVVQGESFQVQYTIRDAEKVGNFKAPAFNHFRFVSGPNQYNGSVATTNGKKPLRNFVYTLEALKPGRFVIPGAVATLNGKTVRSNDVVIDVISKEQATKLSDRNAAPVNSDYLLRPGEDPYEKIGQNLFLKLVVNRTNCFAGEPVLAVFKLYSRLQSKSDIIKNPGFYGFTVYDMVNLNDKEATTEELNGKVFDVHTIRKVQLFPLQAGLFTIDAMEVKNKVEFSRSVVNKKTEQKIAEGIFNSDETDRGGENTEIYETNISTKPVVIQVKPAPSQNRPASFNGAVGHFSISSSLVKNRIAKNEEGVFEITISGSGNFTQLNAPVLNWPSGIEVFEPAIIDSIDKTTFPLSGSRKFRYTFICAHPRQYQIPAARFIYFEPGSSYKTVLSLPAGLEVNPEEKINTVAEEKRISITDKNTSASRTAAIIIISLVVIILIYWIRYKKEPVIKREEKTILPTVEELLIPAGSMTDAGTRDFYATLHQSIWKFFSIYFHLSGSDMNKENLMTRMKARGAGEKEMQELHNVLKQCEAGMFTKADMYDDKKELLDRTGELLKRISLNFFQQV